MEEFGVYPEDFWNGLFWIAATFCLIGLKTTVTLSTAWDQFFYNPFLIGLFGVTSIRFGWRYL